MDFDGYAVAQVSRFLFILVCAAMLSILGWELLKYFIHHIHIYWK